MIDRWRALPPYPRRVLMRLACVPLLWLLGTIAVFVVMRILADQPDVVTITGGATDEQIEEIRKALGLDRSYFEQYTDWLTGLFRGDFGSDVFSGRSIRTQVWNRLEPTATALLLGLTFSALISLLLARVSQVGSIALVSTRAFIAMLASIPIGIATIVYLVLPARWWNHAPPIGAEPSIRGDLSDFALLIVLPSMACGAIAAGFTASAVSRHLAQTGWNRSAVLHAVGASTCGSLPILMSLQVVVEEMLTIVGLGSYLFRMSIVRGDAMQTLLAIVLLVSLVAWTFHPHEDYAPRRSEDSPSPAPWLLVPGLSLAGIFLIIAIVGPLFGDDVGQLDPTTRLLSPSLDHPFGTDNLGRDQLERVIAASRTSLKYALVPVLLGLLPGVVIGLGATRAMRIASDLLLEAAKLWQAMPLLPILLLFASAFYGSFWRVTIPLILTGFAVAIIVARSSDPFDLARQDHRRKAGLAVAAGASTVTATAILAEFTLTFLGASRFEDISFGLIVRQGTSLGSPIDHMYVWIIPSVIVMAILFGFVLIRRSLDDEVPPHMYER